MFCAEKGVFINCRRAIVAPLATVTRVQQCKLRCAARVWGGVVAAHASLDCATIQPCN
jgi:hypothetical protein